MSEDKAPTSPSCTYTLEEVIEMRRRRKQDPMIPVLKLVREYGGTFQTAWQALIGASYKWVDAYEAPIETNKERLARKRREWKASRTQDRLRKN